VSSPSKGEGGKPHLVSTTVKRANEEVDGTFYLGVCSNYLCNLKPGDKLKVTGPSGRRYLLPENKEDFNYVFFATGTGIAPFRGMILELFEAGITNQVALVFGCPYRTDLIYPKYFNDMEGKHDNFHYIKMISREDRRKDGSKYYVQTAIEDRADVLDPILSKENTLIYLCGMKGMESGIYHNLAKRGHMGYIRFFRGEPASSDPNEWTWDEVKKHLKPSERTFEEVY
jgi:ferredoxin--NADP+ reductase